MTWFNKLLHLFNKILRRNRKMPWTIADVDSHNKGLSDAQKKKWVSTANAVLAECEKKGGTDCDAKAIRIANGTVSNNLRIGLNFTQVSYMPEIVEWEGRQYLVVPVVMMVEGVHNGSHGPVYHSLEELGRIEEAWNGMPITLSHPKNVTGEYVSANSPEILGKWSIGRVFNARIEDGKLKAEAWVDIAKLASVSPNTLTAIQQGRVMEISVGIFSDEEYTEGNWNGEDFIAIAKNYRPDHLALLPEEVGACSVNDGCGLRVNSDIGSDGTVLSGDSIIATHYGETFTVGTTGTGGDPTVVDVTDIQETDSNLINSKMCSKCPEKVQALVDSPKTNFDESDLEWLSTLDEDKLDKLIPKLSVETEIKLPTVEEAWEVVRAGLSNLDDYIKLLPEDVRQQVNVGLEVFQRVRQETITSIQANTEKDTWKNEDLEKMSLDVLKKIEKSIQKKSELTDNVDYSLRGVREDIGSGSKVKPMPLPGVSFK
jgi:hypothetical protein